jgi:TonB-linked SusC/RagA family outer membrane protein
MKRNVFLTFLLFVFVGFNLHAQGFEVTGKVTSADDGSALPGVSVVVQGTTIGAVTNYDGEFAITVPKGDVKLMFSFVGMATQVLPVGSATSMNVVMEPTSSELEEVVVTALGISREKKSLGYAVQEVEADEINVTSSANIRDALVGKVAGIQFVGQAGSKLGETGRIRIRGAVSMTTDGDPLYVVDGIVVADPNVIDMENVENVSVLKGPNATALYGQRAEYGVIMITTKTGKGEGVTVEINSNTTFENVAYLPNYQNQYGGGYDGEGEWTVMEDNYGRPEWDALVGQKFIFSGYADESWGPEFDGSDYIAWYNYWPDSPYHGQTAKWEAQPNNIKDFYNQGVTLKNSVALSGSTNQYTARVSYTNIDQKGVFPYSTLNKNMVNGNVKYNASKRLSVTGNFSLSNETVLGDHDDSYSNNTTGSFSAWFNRNVEADKLRELVDLQTTNGYHASWNYWSPPYGEYFGTENGAFWYNPYFWLKHYQDQTDKTRVIGKVEANYKINEKFEVVGNMTTSIYNYSRYFQVPNIIANSADPGLYNAVNSGFGNYKSNSVENNMSGYLKYNDSFGDIGVRVMAGGNIRNNSYDRFSAEMPIDSKTQGLVIPDVFVYSNTKEPVTAGTSRWNKEVRSVFANASFDYKGLIYLDATARQDWSSALPANNNGYFYPSVGGSFIFSNLIDNDLLSFGKIRAGWAQIGTDLDALLLNPTYPLSTTPYFGLPQMYTNARAIDPNITPAKNTSIEAGFDVNFLQDMVGLGFTYFTETRVNEIIPVAMSTATGYTSYLTNAGSARRSGIELTLNASPVKTQAVKWDIFLNYGKSKTEILELPGDLESMDGPGGSDDWDFVQVTHNLDPVTGIGSWGELRGIGIKKDDNGNNIVNPTGTYETEQNVYLGSILPDFTGGMLNNFTFFDLISVSASIDFQKGGNFFSLSEMWGQYSGLLEETAGNNDKGGKIRDAVADDGGVHVTGVLADGTAFDDYVDSYDYWTQFNANSIAEPFIHDASFIKLREVGVSLIVPKSLIESTFIKQASIGFVGRNLWIATSKDNVHNWDPSEISNSWGENAQMPGTKSFGFNVKLTF